MQPSTPKSQRPPPRSSRAHRGRSAPRAGGPAAPGSRAAALAPSPPGWRNARRGHTSATRSGPTADRGTDRSAPVGAGGARARRGTRSSRSGKATSETAPWAQNAPAPATPATASPVPNPPRPARTRASDSNEPQARADTARRADGMRAHPRPAHKPAADADLSPGLGRSSHTAFGVVLVVASDPELPCLALIASLGARSRIP
jgi:hypothetical protein